jgi:pyrroloquinoline quinone (PQQ) biosynthesis protein C
MEIGMARMIRKQVSIEPRHERMLKRLARASGVSEAQIVRQALFESPFSEGFDLSLWT